MPSGDNSASKILAKMQTDTSNSKKERENERLLKMLIQCEGPSAPTKLLSQMTSYDQLQLTPKPLPVNVTKTRRSKPHSKVKIQVKASNTTTRLPKESKRTLRERSFVAKLSKAKVELNQIPSSDPAPIEARIDRMLCVAEHARTRRCSTIQVLGNIRDLSAGTIGQNNPESRIDKMLFDLEERVSVIVVPSRIDCTKSSAKWEQTAAQACLTAFGAEKVGDILDALPAAPRRMTLIAVPEMTSAESNDSNDDSEGTHSSYSDVDPALMLESFAKVVKDHDVDHRTQIAKSRSVPSQKAKTVQVDPQQFAKECSKS